MIDFAEHIVRMRRIAQIARGEEEKASPDEGKGKAKKDELKVEHTAFKRGNVISVKIGDCKVSCRKEQINQEKKNDHNGAHRRFLPNGFGLIITYFMPFVKTD